MGHDVRTILPGDSLLSPRWEFGIKMVTFTLSRHQSDDYQRKLFGEKSREIGSICASGASLTAEMVENRGIEFLENRLNQG
jgi:hypothetical protein